MPGFLSSGVYNDVCVDMPLCLDSSIRLSLSVCIFVVAFLAVTMMSTRIARERALDSGLRVE